MQNPPTAGLKWTAADDSSPLGILLSKHSPEIAAKNANTTTALDCRRPFILTRYIDADLCPSQAQQCKQTGAGGADAEMALNDDGTRAAYTAVEQRESVVHTADGVFRRVEENATAVDPEGRRVNISVRAAIAQEEAAEDAEDEDAAIDPTSLSSIYDDFLAFKKFSLDVFSTQLKDMQRHKVNVQDNLLEMQQVQLTCAQQMHKIENVLLYLFKANGEQEKQLAVARQTQNAKLEGMQREMETMHNYYERKVADVVKNSAELEKAFDASRKRQTQMDKVFDDDYEANFNEVKSFINKHGNELDALQTALGRLEGKIQGPVLPAPSQSQDMLSEMAASLLHLKLNANGKRAKTKQRSQAQDPGQAKRAKTMQQDSIKSLALVVAGVVHDAQLASLWKASSHNAMYDKVRYDAKAYIMSDEFAYDDAAGIFVSHPLENIQIYGKKYTFKTSYNGVIFESAKMTLAETFQARRAFCQQAERAHWKVVKKWRLNFKDNQSAGKRPNNAAADANNMSKDAQNNAAADANDTSKDAQNNAAADANATSKDAQKNFLLSTAQAQPSGQAQPSSVGASAHTEHLEETFLAAADTQASTQSDSSDDDAAIEASSTPFEKATTGA